MAKHLKVLAVIWGMVVAGDAAAAVPAQFIDGSLLFNGSADGSNTPFDSTLEAGVVVADAASGSGSTGSGLVNALADLSSSITSQGGITTVLMTGSVGASTGGDSGGFAFISIETSTLQFQDDPIILELTEPAYFKIESTGTFTPNFEAVSGSIGETQLSAGTYSLSFFMFVTVGSGTPSASQSMEWTLQLSETPFGEPVLGDINDDGIVDGADLGLLLGAWGSADSAADLNDDGAVDGADLGLLLGAWSS